MPGTALQLVGAGSVALASAETCRLTAAEQDASFVARVCFFHVQKQLVLIPSRSSSTGGYLLLSTRFLLL